MFLGAVRLAHQKFAKSARPVLGRAVFRPIRRRIALINALLAGHVDLIVVILLSTYSLRLD
jgi:hypothetical protein